MHQTKTQRRADRKCVTIVLRFEKFNYLFVNIDNDGVVHSLISILVRKLMRINA